MFDDVKKGREIKQKQKLKLDKKILNYEKKGEKLNKNKDWKI